MKTLSFIAGIVVAGRAVLALAASPEPVKTREFLAVVQSNAELADRARALQQLALKGDPESVPVLAALLGDARLAQYARDALEQMPEEAAGAALRAALTTLEGRTLAGVVSSVGQRRDPLAVGALAKIAAGPSSIAAGAALVALGHIGTPEALRVLESALERSSVDLRAAAAEGCLLVADRLNREGRRSEARRLYDRVRRTGMPMTWRVAATRGAILAGGPAGLKLLRDELRSPIPELRDLALGVARELRDPQLAPTLVAELDKLAPPQQAATIAALVDLRDPRVLPAIEMRAKAGAEEVRVAALQALGTAGSASSVPILLEAVCFPSSVAASTVAWSSLVSIAAPGVESAILRAWPTANPSVKARLIGVLGDRGAESATPELMKLAADVNPEIAKAAFRALGAVAKPAELPQLIQLALAVADDDVRTLADRAIVTTAMKVLEPERRAETVLRRFEETTDPGVKAALLRPLGAIVRTMGGNHEVFFALRLALPDSPETVRDAILRCLADWPDAAPTTVLLDFVNRKDVTLRQHEAALRGAVRMAGNVTAGRERSPLNAVEAFGQANRAARTLEEKMMVVAGLGGVPRLEAVQMLHPYLDDSAVKAAAALAIVQVAEALPAPKGRSAVQDVLERIVATAADAEVRREAEQLLAGHPATAVKGKAAPTGQRLAPVVPLNAGQLFNGVDLGNWDGDPGVWRVREGVIVGGSVRGNPRNAYLATRKRYRNFVLTLEYRLVGTEGFVNSGVQVRSERQRQHPNEMSGYQADIGAGHSGCLYDEACRNAFVARAPAELIQKIEKVSDWNRYEIRCEGSKIELTLNGQRTVTYIEDHPHTLQEGVIALQVHGKCQAEVSFRNLAIEILP